MFSHLPQLNNIRVLESAARLGSFKAAAEELHLSPTAVSHQIRKLESRLGVLLFERGIRSITLTQEGTKLAHSSYQALQELSSTFENISTIQSVLRVTTTSSFASMWLVPNLDKFYQQHPDITVEIKTGEQLDDFEKDRRIDVAIRYGNDNTLNNDSNKLITESIDAYVAPDYLKDHNVLSQAKLIETQWKNKALAPISWKQWLQKNSPNYFVADKQMVLFDQEQHVVQAALARQGIALVSSILVQMHVQNEWLVPYQHNGRFAGLSYYFHTSPFSQGLPKVSLFKQWITQELLSLRKKGAVI